MTANYLQQQMNEIIAWEAQEPWMITTALNYALSPLAWAARIVVPDVAISGMMTGADWIAGLTARESWVLAEAGTSTLAEVKQLPLQQQDAMADSVHNWSIAQASAEGALTGTFGLPGIAADIPAIITIAFRTIRQVALCYGFPIEGDTEYEFAVSVLGLAGATSNKDKLASLAFLQAMKTMIGNSTIKQMGTKAASTKISQEAVFLSLKHVAKQLGYNLTKKKALQVIPAIGGVVGGTSNGAFIRSVGWAARRAYQRRLLEERGEQIVAGPQQP